MAGKRGFGSIGKLPSGNFRARYTGPDRKMHAAPHTFTNKSHAAAWLVSEENLISRDVWTAPETRAARPRGTTVGELVEHVITARQARTRKPLAQTTADLYRKDYRLRLKDGLGDVIVSELTPTTISNWWSGLDPDTPSQNSRAYLLLKSCLADAVEDGIIATNPARIKGAGKPLPQHQGQALSVSETLAYIDAVPKSYRLALAVTVWCGLRSGETRGLRVKDVDLGRKQLHIAQAVSRVHTGKHTLTWRIAPPKTAAGLRTVALPGTLVEPLRQWIHDHPGLGPDDLLFPAKDGRSPLACTVLRDAHLKGRAAIDRPELRIHDLRRTAATLAAREGATTRELMRLLGHTTVGVAMIYQVPDDARDQERARRLDHAIEKAHHEDDDSKPWFD